MRRKETIYVVVVVYVKINANPSFHLRIFFRQRNRFAFDRRLRCGHCKHARIMALSPGNGSNCARAQNPLNRCFSIFCSQSRFTRTESIGLFVTIEHERSTTNRCCSVLRLMIRCAQTNLSTEPDFGRTELIWKRAIEWESQLRVHWMDARARSLAHTQRRG